MKQTKPLKKIWICPACNKRRKCKIVGSELYINHGNLTEYVECEPEKADTLNIKCLTCFTLFETDRDESSYLILKLPTATELLEGKENDKI